MKTVNPYLYFKGNAEEAFNFYKSVFRSKITGLQRYGDTPAAGKISAEDRGKILHIAMPMGTGNVLMGSDIPSEENNKLVIGNDVSLTIDTDSQEEATRLFNELSAGGTVEMPMQKTFWNAYYGMCTDKFKIHWMINYNFSQQQ